MYDSHTKSIQSQMLLVILLGPFHYADAAFRTLWSGSFPTPQAKNKSDHKGRLYSWCGRRESNPRLQLGKLTCCHYTTPTKTSTTTQFYTKTRLVSRIYFNAVFVLFCVYCYCILLSFYLLTVPAFFTQTQRVHSKRFPANQIVYHIDIPPHTLYLT